MRQESKDIGGLVCWQSREHGFQVGVGIMPVELGQKVSGQSSDADI